MQRWLSQAVGRHAGWLAAGLALITSLVFCFVVYPDAATTHHALLDPDSYGRLGWGLWKYGSLSFYPDQQPTVSRGPAYPAFLAVLLAATNGWWPMSAQVGQCLVFAATCWLVWWLASGLWGRAAGTVAALACAVHPFLVWYTSRIWIETLAAFLFTALLAALLWHASNPRAGKAVLAGGLLGLCILGKSTFLPYIAWVPLGLLLLKPRRFPPLQVIVVPVVALAMVLPWTARNWRLTHRIIPVHLPSGSAFDGDTIIAHFREQPFALGALCEIARVGRHAAAARIPPEVTGAAREYEYETSLLRASTQRYADHPLFLLKKTIMNAGLFWTLGETRRKSLVISVLVVPFAALFFLSCVLLVRERRMRTFEGIAAAWVLLYYLSLLPINAVARYSMPIVPAVVMYAASLLRTAGRPGLARAPDARHAAASGVPPPPEAA